jgi:hypothetical protein
MKLVVLLRRNLCPPGAGAYTVKVVYFDEADGPATIEVRIAGTLVDSWTLTQNTDQLLSRTVVTGYNFSSNTVFEIKGIRNNGEHARIDYVEFTSTSAKVTGSDTYAPQASVPDRLSLIGNFPNPFNPSTSIRFTVPAAMEVSLEIFSITGQRIRTIVSTVQTLGEHSIVWDGRDDDGLISPSGVYVYRLNGGGVVTFGRMSLEIVRVGEVGLGQQNLKNLHVRYVQVRLRSAGLLLKDNFQKHNQKT